MIRILLAHSSRLVSDSLRTALDNEEDIYVVGCASTGEELHFLLPHGNVALVGTEFQDTTAFDLIDDIRMTHPQTKVVVLGINDDPDEIIRYIEAGASGYILQNESIEDMVQKLNALQEEKAIISPSVAAAMMERLTRLANMTGSRFPGKTGTPIRRINLTRGTSFVPHSWKVYQSRNSRPIGD
ncbi:MAG: response regulator [Chloroflexi bacterium]|nr:response regulator [Chloroflexota bacterium]